MRNTEPGRSLALTVASLMVAAVMMTAPGGAEAEFSVAVVPSDDAALASPVPRDRDLDTDQVEQMVRRAVSLIGGMGSVVPDTAGLVVLKVNISVIRPRRSGAITDDRVARAVALLVHEVAPQARIRIAEGAGGWASPEFRDRNPVDLWEGMYVDGFERAGHRQTVAELRARGIDIACLDLNFDEAYTLQVPGGGLATDEYDVAASILDADVWINLPVAKTHGAKITCCMKNHFGLLPGRLYGWSKSRGTEHHPAIPHSPRVLDEAFVDLWALTRMDLNVVDMLTGSERGPFEETTRRQNIILAGRDPVATDLVAARLMGYNPDDLEFADLAWQQGMGPRWLENVDVRGTELAPLVQRFEKAGVWYDAGTEWQEQADYGKGPRRWSLLGPLPRDHVFTDAEIAALSPTPGEDDWSEVIWFGPDKIDLDGYYDDPVRCAVYGYVEFTTPRADSVRYWMGADERLQVWIDGQPLYDTDDHPELGRRRRHHLGMVRVPGYLDAGAHRLLVRAEQNRGRFDFSFNVCEPIDDERFAGNTFPGLRYRPAKEGEPVVRRVTTVGPADDEDVGPLEGLLGDLPMTPHPVRRARVNGDTISVEAHVAPADDDLPTVLAAAAGVAALPVGLAWLDENPFGMVPVGPQRFLDLLMSNPYRQTPTMDQIARLLGVQYELGAGFGFEESVEAVREWLQLGHLPVVGLGDEWGVVSGIRGRDDGGVEMRMAGTEGGDWHHFDGTWWARLPGYGMVNCPVFAAQGDPRRESGDLAARLATIALDMALTPVTTTQVMWWGVRPAPAGLAAWDYSVTHWERLPLTPAWADRGLNWSLLARTRVQHLEPLIERRRHCALLLRDLAADGLAGAPELALAAQAYGEVVARLEELIDALPSDPRAYPGTGQPMTINRKSRGLLRAARTAEREALQALSTYLGRGPLPPVQNDPLTRVESGYRVLTSRAAWSREVWELSLQGEGVNADHIHGSYAEDVDFRVLAGVPQEPGWILAVESDGDAVAGWVTQQPTAENEWEARLRMDSLSSWWGDGEVAFTVWAIPDEVTVEGGRP